MSYTLVHIHGGESFRSEAAYERFLQEWEIEDPFASMSAQEPAEKPKKWKERYEELLPSVRVLRPRMPCSLNAKFQHWAWWFEKYFPYLDGPVVFVGHSLGGIFLLQYLAAKKLPQNITLKQLHVVAAPVEAGDFVLPADLARVAKQAQAIFLYHSTDDPVVPYQAAKEIQTRLPEAELISFDDRGHFLGPDFPELFQRLQRVS